MPVQVETVVSQWKGFDWENLRERIERDVISHLSTEQQDLLTSRKHLVDTTKEFRKLEDTDKLNGMKDLLREYQLVIDDYARKFSGIEALLTELLKPLLVLTNPVNFIEQANNLRCNLDEQESLKEQIQHIKGDLESVKSQLAQAEAENASLKESNSTLESQLTTIKADTDVLKADHSGATDLIVKLKEEKGVIEKQIVQERENYEKELENVNVKLRQQNGTIGSLQSELEIMTASLTQERMKHLELEQELSRLRLKTSNEKPIEDLILKHKAELNQMEESWKHKLETKDIELTSLKKEQENIRERLEEISDYHLIKQELEDLKREHFGGLSGEDAALSTTALQASQIKKLESQLVSLRLQLDKSDQASKTLTEKLEVAWNRVKELELTVEKYENLIQSPNASTEHMEIKGDDVITVLSNQRDRYKKRNLELESQVEGLQRQLDSTSMEMSKVRSESSKLYERLRYLENHATFKGSVRKDPELGEVHEKYSPMYDERHDPFNHFYQSEFMKRFRELGRIDQAFYKLVRIFFTNRMWRKISMIYFILLHVALLFLITSGRKT